MKLGGRPRWGRLTLGFMADRDVLDVVQREIADEVRTRFPGAAVQRVPAPVARRQALQRVSWVAPPGGRLAPQTV